MLATAVELFDGIKKRLAGAQRPRRRSFVGSFRSSLSRSLADNVVLKLHNSFLVPMSEHLYGEIQQKVTRLTDQELDTMFEVKVTIARLKEDEVMLGQVTKRFEELEKEFVQAADQFSRSRK